MSLLDWSGWSGHVSLNSTFLIRYHEGGPSLLFPHRSAAGSCLTALRCSRMTAGRSNIHALHMHTWYHTHLLLLHPNKHGGVGGKRNHHPSLSAGAWNTGDPIRHMPCDKKAVKQKVKRICAERKLWLEPKSYPSLVSPPSTNTCSLTLPLSFLTPSQRINERLALTGDRQKGCQMFTSQLPELDKLLHHRETPEYHG